MALVWLPGFSTSNFAWLIVGSICAILLSNYFNHGLLNVPGPFFAKFTDLWRLLDVHKGNHHWTVIELHRRYGTNVRLGPNYVSVADPRGIQDIYGLNKGYEKSGFYDPFRASKGGQFFHTLFSDRNEKHHAATKKPIANAYSMTTLTDFEPFVDDTIRTMLHRLEEEFCKPDMNAEPCDMASWLQYYAFDVVAEITFSRALGFLDRGEDVGNMMHKLETRQDYNAVVGQMPWLDHVLKKNPLLRLLSVEPDKFSAFSRSLLQERQSGADGYTGTRKDLLSRFMAAKKKHPDIVDDSQVISYMMTSVLAGSDTTAISLRSIIYYVLKDKKIHTKLLTEIDKLKEGFEPVSWQQSQADRPYLDAVIKETFRIHPAVGLGLERIVPGAGLTLPDGTFLCKGTIVGINAWAIHRDQSIFGPNVDSFDPARWLRAPQESEEGYKHRIGRMGRANLVFGMGPRTCIGKNVSLLEIYKLIPTLFACFEMELADPSGEWRTTNKFFVRQSGLNIVLRKRSAV